MAKDSVAERGLAKGYSMEQLRKLSWDEFLEVTGAEPRTIAVKQNGRRYACLDVPYWDPEKKSATHRRKVIGYYDDDGNLVMTGSEADTRPRTRPRPETYARTEEIGLSLLLGALSERTGVGQTVSDVFGDDAPAIMTCVHFLAGHSGALCHCEQWSAGSENPFGGRLADQRISELLQRIDEDRRARFLKRWVERLGDDDNYALDITSISSYSESIEGVRAGYNRDGESLEQVNLALMIGTESHLPAYYSFIPGNINDKTSLKRFIHTVRAQGFTRFSLVMDKGFYSEDNVNELYRMRLRYLIGVENRISRCKETIDRVRDDIKSFDNYHRVGTSSVYCTSEIQRWPVGDEGHRCYVHVYFDPQRREDEIRHFSERLDAIRGSILRGEKAAASSSLARSYLRVTGRGKKVKVTANQEAIDEWSRYSGFLVLMSNHIKDPRDALEVYRSKETAESGFDDLKNGMDMNRLRIHSEAAMEGKAFLAFLALILRIGMSNIMAGDPSLAHISREEVLSEMTLLRRTSIGGKGTIYTERTRLQKKVIRAFGIKAPFRDEIPQDGEGSPEPS